MMRTAVIRSSARRAAVALATSAVLLVATGAVKSQGQRFYPDDPIAREPETQDASKAAPYDMSAMYVLMYNLFVTSEYQPTGERPRNSNPIDEGPDSSWFTNRLGTRRLTTDALVRGPDVGAPDDP